MVYGITLNDNYEIVETLGFLEDIENDFTVCNTLEELNKRRASLQKLQKRHFFRNLKDHSTPFARQLEEEIWGSISDEAYTPGEYCEKYIEKDTTMKYGVKIENEDYVVKEGTEKELRNDGYEFLFGEKRQAITKGKNLRFAYLAKLWEKLDDYSTDRALELEGKLWGNLEDYVPGMYCKSSSKTS